MEVGNPSITSPVQDKVNISVAIIAMSRDFGWSPTVSGIVQSSFFAGYMATQIPGGYIISRLGGRRVLPAGVSLWSLATAATPIVAGTLPGNYPPSPPPPSPPLTYPLLSPLRSLCASLAPLYKIGWWALACCRVGN